MNTIDAPHWTVHTMARVAAADETLAEVALRYANLGIPVFACVPGGKQPITPNGFHDATASTRAVRHWWARTPDANIGLPTGSMTGVLVVDVDVHGADSGYGGFERSRKAGIAEGWGWLVRTPSGGLHAYYPAARGREQRSWQAPSAHVDFRGDGGYVIAPPSRITVDGAPTTYEVIAVAHHRPQPIDAGQLRQFLEPSRQQPAPSALPALPALGAHPDRLAGWVAQRPEGGRNAGLFWAACRMAEGGHQYDDAVGLLGNAGRTAGLPDREIETTIRSAYRITSRLSPSPRAAAPITGSGQASRPGPTEQAGVIGL
ncbi:bifunctional DNA primase/polymerase [Nocardioides carbamazepini]|uniref:bifunctional DNA primase/polymerase n=1 Tax=Nocardioides carbamazepini TaxID=2854259 RepID=UPI002149D6EF|nr:bifunctional DNA primase/polymerase [Nocardioides carbamazepini]MCR1785909.1 bifunctional DNA primase/polymerase [Nocardioides carbamazepini]